MKRKLFLLFLIICCLALTVGLLVACNPGSFEQNVQPGGDDGGKDETLFFTVTFDTQGGSKIADIKVESGHLVGEFTFPTKQCSRFVGFALDAGGERIWNVLTDKVSADITLYAIWEDAHDWGDWIIITPATCTKNGEKMRTCNACGETEKEIVPAAHTWDEMVTITAPTCTEEGTQKRLCEVCGKEETVSIPAIGHDWEEEYTVEIVPGCETKGSESRHCTRCDATTDNREIAALGHDYDGAGWHYNGANHWKCCTRCGKESERELHSYDSDGVCECGMIEVTPVNEFRFISLGNNTWRLANYTGSRTNASIPSTYNNGTVVSISDDAFSGNTAIQTLVIPDTVTSIGARSFSGCVNLTSITISKNLATIGVDAFEGCTKIADASIPAIATQSIYKAALVTLRITAGDVEERAFENCGSLNSVVIESGVNSIGAYCFSGCSSLAMVELAGAEVGHYAFQNCVKLVSVKVNDGVHHIYDYAFLNCAGISEIELPDTITTIGSGAFSGCSGLVEMKLPFVGGSADATSPSESTLFGYIFGSSSFPGAFETVQLFGTEEGASATYYIPRYLTSVTVGGEILFGAFYGCDRIENITLTAATALSDYAFYNNMSLTEIIIPDSVESIGEMTFAYCTALEDLDFSQSIKMVGINAMMESAWYDAQLEGIVYIGKTLYDYKGTMPSNMEISVPDGIYSISEEAFAGCSGLHSIIITDSVKSIGARAFYNCYGLTSIIIGDGVQSIGEEAFAGCSRLKNVTMPAIAIDYIPQDNLQTVSITKGTIGEKALYKCDSLISVTIGNSVTGIGSYAFSGCTGLTEINWNAVSVKDFTTRSDVFYNAGNEENGITVTFGDNVQKIPAYAFYNCTSLTSVTIPDGVTSIGSYAFYGCSSLTSVTIPDSVKSIGEGAFSGCTSLTSVTIPDSVTIIGGGAFYKCTSLDDVYYTSDIASWLNISFGNSSANPLSNGANLYLNGELATDIVIPDSVTSIGDNAFYGCTSLTSVTIPDSVTIIGDYEFYNCTSLTSVTIPDSVTSIGDYAFRNCYSLTSVTIGDSVTSIGWYAFYNCTSLTSVAIPDGVTSIGDEAFYNCSSLTSVTIPDSVTSIGSFAFYGCTGLTEINWNAVSVNDFTERSDVFYNAGKEENGITVTFGDNVQKIPAYAFYVDSSSYYPNIKRVIIGNSVTSIGSYAFYGCTSLSSVTIGNGVTSIGVYAFSNCTGLTEINWNAVSVNDFTTNSDVFYNAGNGENRITVTFGDNVQKIPALAFYNCTSLTSVTIGNSVTSIGSYAFSGCTGLTEINWNAVSVKDFTTNSAVFYNAGKEENGITVTFGDSVQKIPALAFYNCTSLSSVTIGNSVTSIGDNAFYACTGLTEINWNAVSVEDFTVSSNVFYNAGIEKNGITVTFGDSVQKIPAYAFYNCTSLTSITIPDSVTSIGSHAFYNTPYYNNLPNGEVYLGKVLYKYKGNMPSNYSVIIKEGTVSISDNAFYECTSLTSVTIPDSVTSIGNSAFSDCTSLTSVTIGDGVTSIGDNAFYRCTSLTSVAIPDSVTSIGRYAFSDCTSLTSVTIPASVTSIRDGVFSGCTSLETITVDSGNSVYHSAGNCLIETSTKKLIAGCKNSVIPDDGSVTSIGDEAFSNCDSLTSVTIPDSVTSIGDNAFYGCPSLTSVIIPDSVTSIGSRAFSGCTLLTSVTIGDGVTSIDWYAFNDCTSLTSVTFEGTMAQWYAISKDSDWNNNTPFTKVVCSNGTVSV